MVRGAGGRFARRATHIEDIDKLEYTLEAILRAQGRVVKDLDIRRRWPPGSASA